MKVNVYDFDGTIYNGDSSKDFYLFCLKKKFKIIRRLPMFFINVILYLLGKISKEKLKENYFSFLKDFDKIDKIVAEFWKCNSKKLKKFYLEKKHNEDIIISASPYFLLKPICKKLKVKELIATDVNKNTGEFNSLNCYGEEKIKRLSNKYKDIKIKEFYTDSLSDMPLINIAEKSYIIEGDKVNEYKKDNSLNNNFFDIILEILYNSGVYLLISFALLLIIVNIFWICKLSLLKESLYISFLLGGFISFKYLKGNKKNIILSILIGIFALIVSICISNYVYDQSYDGNAYHKETIFMMKEGWNPIYDNYLDFAIKNNLTHKHYLWGQHYAKATWIFGSTIYDITNNIESSKFYNILFMYVAFVNIAYLIYKTFSKKILSILVAFIAVVNPIMISQVFTLYIDGLLGLFLFLNVIYMYLFVIDDNNKLIKLSLGSVMIILINIKFTGFGYCGLFCAGYYIYYLITKAKKKDYKSLINNTIYFVEIVLISLLIVGSASYLKNTIDKGNPFYPLLGEGKVDIMTHFQPSSFDDMPTIVRNFYSIFSRSGYVSKNNNLEPQLKIPFIFDKKELRSITYDTRIGGYGVLFSGLFIISIILIILFTIFAYLKKEKNTVLYLIPLIVTLLLMFFLADGWWARYSPQLYLFILISVLLFGLNSNKRCLKVSFGMYSFLIILNSMLCFYGYYDDFVMSQKTKILLDENREYIIDVYLPEGNGVLANLKDRNIKYNIVSEKTDDMKSLYGEYIYYKISEKE